MGVKLLYNDWPKITTIFIKQRHFHNGEIGQQTLEAALIHWDTFLVHLYFKWDKITSAVRTYLHPERSSRVWNWTWWLIDYFAIVENYWLNKASEDNWLVLMVGGDWNCVFPSLRWYMEQVSCLHPDWTHIFKWTTINMFSVSSVLLVQLNWIHTTLLCGNVKLNQGIQKIKSWPQKIEVNICVQLVTTPSMWGHDLNASKWSCQYRLPLDRVVLALFPQQLSCSHFVSGNTKA